MQRLRQQIFVILYLKFSFFLLVKPRYFEYDNQPSLLRIRDLVPAMPRLAVWFPSPKLAEAFVN